IHDPGCYSHPIRLADEFGGGVLLRATNFAFDATHALVAYNMAGEKIEGALDVIDLADAASPALVASLVPHEYGARRRVRCAGEEQQRRLLSQRRRRRRLEMHEQAVEQAADRCARFLAEVQA